MRLISTSELMPGYLVTTAVGTVIGGFLGYNHKYAFHDRSEFSTNHLVAAVAVFSTAFFFAKATQKLIKESLKLKNVEDVSKNSVSYQNPQDYQAGSFSTVLLAAVKRHVDYRKAVAAHYNIPGNSDPRQVRSLLEYDLPTGRFLGDKKFLHALIATIEGNEFLQNDVTLKEIIHVARDFLN